MNSIAYLYELFQQHPKIITDSRKIEKDCIFWSLKGDNFNGNDFAIQALEKGAAYAIVDDIRFQHEKGCIYVAGGLTTLQKLASWHRKQLNIPIIGLTGSNGKTTSKELMRAVLSQKYRVYATRGNLNNHIGVSLSLLELNSRHELAVIEMGANHQGEIAQLSEISAPNYGFITNIGLAHLEGFGGPEGVKKGKKELFDYLRATSGKAFVNSTDKRIVEVSKGVERILFGDKTDEIHAEIFKNEPFLGINLFVGKTELKINTQLTGTYNLPNIVAAAAIGNYFEVKADEIKKGIESYCPDNNRSQIKDTGKNQLILDAYNANPDSMQVAIRNLADLSAPSKFFILGDMRELGEYTNGEHQKILELVKKEKLEGIFVGEAFFGLRENNNNLFFTSTDEAYHYLEDTLINGKTILLKGSRGIQLEKLVPLL